MYRYYVSYAHAQGFGSAECTTSNPLTSYEEVTEMAEKICQSEGLSKVIILNYILLRKDEC